MCPAQPSKQRSHRPGADLRGAGRILLISCYELGHIPHGLAMPLGFLEQAGYAPRAVDLAVQSLPDEAIDTAALVVIAVPMHTALRLGIRVAARIRDRNPGARICFSGLYAPLNRAYLRQAGADWVLGGESEAALVALAESLDRGQRPAEMAPLQLVKLRFPRPGRTGLAPLARYARLQWAGTDARPPDAQAGSQTAGSERVIGYTETTRGCLDQCRHCPVPAVYRGRLFAIPADVVVDDIAAQVAAGAQHITFGDPDFFNGPRHGMGILRRMHARWPELTFDITAQVSHLCRRRSYVPELVALGCAFVVTAVESLSDRVLANLAKRHRRADVEAVLDLCADAGLVVRPTLVPFTPWTTLADMRELVDFVAARDLIDHVDPVQLTIRLLVPPGSLLLDTHAHCFGPLEPSALTHHWTHADARMDALQAAMEGRAAMAAARGEEPGQTFAALRALVYDAAGLTPPPLAPRTRKNVPRVTEPWFC